LVIPTEGERKKEIHEKWYADLNQGFSPAATTTVRKIANLDLLFSRSLSVTIVIKTFEQAINYYTGNIEETCN